MPSNLGNIGRVPELRKRLLFTLFMLAVFRVGVFISVPGVDPVVMAQYMKASQSGFLGLFDMFSGGAMKNLSIFALGIMPYISASIIIQLLGVVIPAVERLQKEGDAGRKKINQYTRYGTIVLSMIQGLGISMWLESLSSGAAKDVVIMSGFGFRALAVLSMTTGTCFLMWLGEQITERGIGNGISLIIFAGIVAGIPDAAVRTMRMTTWYGGDMPPMSLLILVLLVAVVVGAIVFFERGQRRIPVQYAKRVVGRKVFGGQNTTLPLKLNSAGVIPPIFASSILLFPSTITNLFPTAAWAQSIQAQLVPGQMLYNILYVAFIIFFCFFYTAVTFNPVDVADNLKKFGGFIPGIRAGKKTADYIDRVLTRVTVGGAIYISLVCVLPTYFQSSFGVSFYFGGTSLLIVVGVALDTVQQIESHLISRNYEGFGGKGGPRVKGRSAA